MPDDPIERTVRQYIAHGAGEGAMSAAQRLSEAVGIGLDEILAAVQKLGPWEAGATFAGEGSLTISRPRAAGRGRGGRRDNGGGMTTGDPNSGDLARTVTSTLEYAPREGGLAYERTRAAREPRNSGGRWETIRYALDSNARTFRLCLILLVTIACPIAAVQDELRKQGMEPPAIEVVDADGKLLPETEAILRLVAQHSMTLASISIFKRYKYYEY
jgi:hypothetical protein